MNKPNLDTLPGILAPLDFSEFIQRYWKREALHIARNDPNYYRDVFTLADLDQLIVQSRLTWQDLRITSKDSGIDYQTLHAMDRPQGPDVSALHNAYSNGRSIIVALRRLWPQIDRLCRSVEKTFRLHGSAELYLTPPNSQAFDIHYDMHDVLLLQLEGCKTWSVYEPVEENVSSLSPGSRICADRVGDPILVCELKKGDLLYIPCGFPHQGLTSDDRSLHITIGVEANLRLHDLLSAMIRVAAAENPLLRHPLNGAYADPDAAGADLSAIDDCLNALRDSDVLSRAMALIEDEFFASLSPVPDGQFQRLDEIKSIDTTTRVAHAKDQFCEIHAHEDGAELRFVGGRVAGPRWLEAQLRWVAATPSFSPSELPGGLSDDFKLSFVRRLLRKGFLRFADEAIVNA